jgi:hypothetical protein
MGDLMHSYQVFTCACGCEFHSRQAAKQLIKRDGEKVCPEHKESIIKKTLYCTCGEVQEISGSYTNGIMRCDKCKAKIKFASDFILTPEVRKAAREKVKYVFNCGCIVDYKDYTVNRKKKNFCPNCLDQGIKEIHLECFICKKIMKKTPQQTAKIICNSCSKDRIAGQKITYSEHKEKRIVNTIVPVVPRRDDCLFYKYCLFDRNIFEENINACNNCLSFKAASEVTHNVIELDLNYKEFIRKDSHEINRRQSLDQSVGRIPAIW